MPIYIIGTCPGCGARNAAAIDTLVGDDMRESVIDFLGCGHKVSVIETLDRVTIESCLDGCPIRLHKRDSQCQSN